MKILVTGASGRLGSCVCRILGESGSEFTAVDKFPNEKADYPIELADLSEWEACRRLVDGIDTLVHLANFSNFNSAPSETLYKANVSMNMNLFQAAANAGCRRIVFASSIQVLDGQLPTKDRSKQENVLSYIPVDSNAPAVPRNAYALSKQAGENMLSYFADTEGMTCIAFRFPLLVDWEFMRKVQESGGLKRGNAYDLFAYLPVYSGAEAVVKATSAEIDGYHNYFIASKDNLEQTPAREFAIQELSHLPCEGPAEELTSLVDCSVVEAELGWQQPGSLEESIVTYRGGESVRPYD